MSRVPPALLPPPGARLVRLAARLVPRCLRDDWCDEWEAELGHAWDARDRDDPALPLRLLLLWRALGALPDALELRGSSGDELMLMQDLRFALRTLARRPSFTALVVLTLALGIGATTAVFTVVDGVLLRPLPYAQPERVMELWTGSLADGEARPYVRADFVEAWQAQDGLLAAVAQYTSRSVVLHGAEPRELRAELVSGEFFPLLGMPPQLGRTLLADDVDANAAVAVISDELWRTEFGADPAIIGRTIALDSARHTVIGVMPAAFRYPRGTVSLWMPRPTARAAAPGDRPTAAIGRLAAHVTPENAQAVADQIGRSLAAERGAGTWTLSLRPIGEWRANADVRRALFVMAGAVAFVLLIACVNAANLLLVQAAARRRELIVRLALGATRGRVVRQLLAESLLLAVASGALGMLLAYWGVQGILALAPSELVDFSMTAVTMDLRVLGFAVAASALTGVLFGVLPAVQATRARASLATTDRTGSGTQEQRRLRGALVIGELALSMMLLVGAGLLMHSFARLASVDAGMEVRRLALVELSPASGRYPTAAARTVFYEAVLERVRAMPGVQGATVASGVAGRSSFSFDTRLEVEGGSGPLSTQPMLLPFGRVDSSYFRIAGIPFQQGRSFEAADFARDANVVIVDEALARYLWADGAALGRRFRLDADSPWLTVVGVVPDVRLLGPDDREGRFDLYYPAPLGAGGQRSIMVRTAGDPALLLAALKEAVRAVDPQQPITALHTAEARFHEQLAKPRFLLALMGVFAAVAAALAGIGLYGVVAFGVAQRTREIGIRLALGARGTHIVGDVLWQGAALALAGVLLGTAGALALTRLLGSLLFGVSPSDPLTIVTVALALGVIALLASWVPARRASRVDPVEALRAE